MTTYALPISEKIAARVASLAAEEVEAINIELADVLEELLGNVSLNPADYPLTEEDIASIRAGLADSEAGRVHDGDEVLAGLRKICGRTP